MIAVVVFSMEERERVRDRLLEFAHADARVIAAAAVGAEARGAADRWSDLDLTFGLPDGTPVDEVLADWTANLAAELDAVDLFDVAVGMTVYRVFLLPGNLQVDLSFAPGAEFGPRGPHFKLLFGTAVKRLAGQGATVGQAGARQVFGLGAHHAVRARFSIERGRCWQAEHWIRGLRDQILELACRRRGLESAHGRDLDRLPSDVLGALEPALAHSLERTELLRALGTAVNALLLEAEEARDLADRLEPQLRELTATTFDGGIA